MTYFYTCYTASKSRKIVTFTFSKLKESFSLIFFHHYIYKIFLRAGELLKKRFLDLEWNIDHTYMCNVLSKIRIAAAQKFSCWQGTSVVALVRIRCTPPPRSHPSWERRQTDRPGADRPPWPGFRAGSSTCNTQYKRSGKSYASYIGSMRVGQFSKRVGTGRKTWLACKRLNSPGIDSASLCSLAGRYYR
jgi:hypothetical protein